MNTKEKITKKEIFGKIENYFGFVLKIFQVLAENPELLKAYFDKVEN